MPENPKSDSAQTEVVTCAFCDSPDTELMSLFGQFLLASQYYCHNCRTVFEAIRWKEDPANGQSSAKRETDGI